MITFWDKTDFKASDDKKRLSAVEYRYASGKLGIRSWFYIGVFYGLYIAYTYLEAFLSVLLANEETGEMADVFWLFPIFVIIGAPFVFFAIRNAIWTISTLIRRMHDFNMSGWWLLLAIFIPVIVSIPVSISGENVNPAFDIALSLFYPAAFIALAIVPSKQQENKFGKITEQSPKASNLVIFLGWLIIAESVVMAIKESLATLNII